MPSIHLTFDHDQASLAAAFELIASLPTSFSFDIDLSDASPTPVGDFLRDELRRSIAESIDPDIWSQRRRLDRDEVAAWREQHRSALNEQRALDRTVALDSSCPKCEAGVLENCRSTTKGSSYAKFVHFDRVRLAYQARAEARGESISFDPFEVQR